MSHGELVVEGAKQNNLKNISLRLPHNKVIAVTGVSGSGKSSLAFDTLFAEGQWRFIESLSTYARLFLEKLDRPDVDAIHNIRPAIALEQKNPVKGSRSTVGTLTEIYDLLRLLYSKKSVPFCPKCNKEIRKWDSSQVLAELIENYSGYKAIVIFTAEKSREDLMKLGFQRVWQNEEPIDINSAKEFKRYDVVLDRLVIKDEPRLSDSIEMAWKQGSGRIKIILLKNGEKNIIRNFSSENSCDECNIELPEPSPMLFSFNHPIGACPECKGFGNTLIYDEDLIVPDKSLSLSEGAVEIWEKPAYKWWKKQMIDDFKKSGIDVKKPYSSLSKEEKEKLFKGTEHFYGIDNFFKDLEGRRYKLHVRVFLSRFRKALLCPVCNGKRLKKEALAYKISELDIAEICGLTVNNLGKFLRDADVLQLNKDFSKEILRQINLKLSFLNKVGLEYLDLNRQGRTLSGGEYQRINLSNQLSSYLTGTLYVLDEPTVGLHPRDTDRISTIMSELSGLGNTIVVVEHDKKIIQSADWVVELGPGGGQSGGEVMFSGTQKEFLQADTLTSRFIKNSSKLEIKISEKQANQSRKNFKFSTFSPQANPTEAGNPQLILYGASGNNLKNVNLQIPLRTITAVTGVSGSGKSSLVVDTFYRSVAKEFGHEPEAPLPHKRIEGFQNIKNIKLIDQTPIGKSPRSNPATYLKIFDSIRKIFSDQSEAKARGYSSGFFSFNITGGRCEACKGEGYQRMEMYFFEDLYIKCEECGGKRYKPDVLRITYKGKNISDVLNMTVDEAVDLFFDIPQIKNKLSLMKEIGLGYLGIGQPATTFSGGESQRLKICEELIGNERASDILYVLDEPTVGLHFTDVSALLGVLRKLVKAGNTVVVIEHNLDVVGASDWIIDIGPEAGEKGGTIVFEGTPDEIIKSKESYTGKYLKEYN